ncbi:MAG: type II toxin-antitoxin system VapC family toxin [Candidatus Omnitrophota bacterium]
MPDTNIWIKILNPSASPVKERFHNTDPETIRLCSVVKAELYYGAYRSQRREQNLELLRHFLVNYASFGFDDSAAYAYGEIRAQLAAQGTPIGPNDLMIASIAVVNRAILITHNTREFQRVPNLEIEDWES